MKRISTIALGTLLPYLTYAEGVYESSRFTDFRSLVRYVTRDLIGPLVSIIFAATVVYFLWGAVQYVRSSDESDGRAEGRDRMIWGIVAIAVVGAFWTLVRIVVSTLS